MARPPLQLSRRHLLGGLAAAPLAGLGLPRVARAASAGDRRFLFVMCTGGWDTTYALTPMFDAPGVEMPDDAALAEVGGISFTDGESRPAVRAFFEAHAAKTAVLHGMEVRSVTHERCRQLVLTGRGDAAADDWPSILGAHGSGDLLLPHLVLAGPAYTDRYSGHVVRVGNAAQLPMLMDGSALALSTSPVAPPSSSAEALEDAFVRQRVADLDAAGLLGQGGHYARRYAEVLDQMAAVSQLDQELELDAGDAGCERDLVGDAGVAFDVFSKGVSRCAMVRYNGWCDEGWDTHQGIELQNTNTQDLFDYLNGILAELDTRTGPDGSPLADSLTIVVFSEMGRHPQYNSWGGKDHWTFTSCMLIGAGVAGGRMVGAMDSDFRGEPGDLASGEASSTGVSLLPEHLGATLLALGDVDPGAHTDAEPITALLA